MVIDNLIETHCHILPAIDDGSPDVEISVKMIDMLKAQGAEAVILTPHFYTDTISLPDFVAKRNVAFNRLKSALDISAPRLIPAAEVYITDYLFNYESLDELCIGASRYMLTEHSFSCDFGQSTYDRLLNLYTEYKVKPLLAHIERYPALMEDEQLLDSYIDMGCLTQVNIRAFKEAPRRARKKLFKYLESGRIHVVGTDCHNLKKRPPEYEAGINEIMSKYGKEPILLFEQNAKKLITG